MSDPAGDLDRISALPDEILPLILSRLFHAAAVTRIAVLSRRWRHVWVHAKNLTFRGRNLKERTVPGYLAGFVDWVLAQRGDAAMDSLEIQFPKDEESRTSPSPEQVNRRLRYAGRRVTKSFDLDIPNDAPADEEVELSPGLGVPARITLHLSHRRLRLPAARYGALTELELFSTRFGEEASGEGRTLGDFVSSCCPRLRRLSVIDARGLQQLVLRAEALQELHLRDAWYLWMLDAAAPDLRVLTLNQSSK